MTTIDVCRSEKGLVDIIRYHSSEPITWFVFRTKCRHYHLAQLVGGKLFMINKRYGKNKIDTIKGLVR